MIDQDRLETARAVLVALVRNQPALHRNPGETITLSDIAVSHTCELHDRLERECPEGSGHPAETALEQLITLLADHPDDKLPKWIAANAKHRKLVELNSYLGADIETP